MKIVINLVAILLVGIIVGFQANRTKDLYKKKYEENKDEFLASNPNPNANSDSENDKKRPDCK